MQSIVTVGIDVSKEKLDIAIFDGREFILKTFSNSEDGVEKLIDYAEERTGINNRGKTKRKEGTARKERVTEKGQATEKETKAYRNGKELSATRQGIKRKEGTGNKNTCNRNIEPKSLHFVMEATGSYHTKALFGISKRNYPVYVLNPVISKRYTEEQMKRVITDKESSKSLAQYAFVSLSTNNILNGQSKDYNMLSKFRFNSKFEGYPCRKNRDNDYKDNGYEDNGYSINGSGNSNCFDNKNKNTNTNCNNSLCHHSNNHSNNRSNYNDDSNSGNASSENNNYNNASEIKSSIKLRILVKTSEGLIRTKTRILNQIEALNQYPEGFSEEAKESLEQLVAEIDKRIEHIRNTIKEMIKDNEETKKIYGRITEIPGIGERTASSIIAYFGSFSSFESAKQVASYIGLTPSIKESGKSVKKKGYAISKTGNPYLRQVLFMASLSASQYNPQCSLLYKRLLNRGKDKKLIHIAVAHKLIRQIFAVVKYGRVYDSSYGISDKEKGNAETKKIDENSLKTKTARKIAKKRSKLKTKPDKIYSKIGDQNMEIFY